MQVTITPDGRFNVTQSFIPPVVYLDHWAVRGLTDNLQWQERFLTALRRCNGTVLLSHLVFAEFAPVLDPRHAVESERFLDQVFPNVFFASINLGDVLRKEIRALRQPPTFLTPPLDPGLIEYFVSKTPSKSFQNMLQPISGSDRLRDNLVRTHMRIAQRVADVRRDPAYVKASRTFRDHQPRAPGLTIFQELCRLPAIDQSMPFDPNDASDFQHAIMALAYCNFALLDKKWVDIAGRVRLRLEKLGVQTRVARAFSKRDVPTFLEELERAPNLGLVRAA